MWPAGVQAGPRVGRDDAWRALLEREERVRAGSGTLTLLEGPPGVGKSTFLRLAIEHAQSSGFRTAFTRAEPSEAPPPFRVIRASLEQIATPRPPRSFASEVSAGSVASTPGADRPGLLAHSRAGSDPSFTDGARSELEADRLRYVDELGAELLDAARKSPLLIAIDDLGRADSASLNSLLRLLPRLASRPVWFLVTGRGPGEEPEADLLERLRASPHVERLTLRPLNRSEVPSFVAAVRPRRRLADVEIVRLFESSRGIPSRIEHLLSNPSARTTATDPDAAGADAFGPASDLAPEAQRLLSLAALIGPEVDLDVVAGAAGLSPERSVELLERFIGRGWMHEVGDGRFAFNSEEMRVKVCASVGARRLQFLHRKVAETLQRSGARDAETIYALARHTYLGGLETESVRYNREASALAANAYQPQLALFYLRHALESLGASAPSDGQEELKVRLAIAVELAHLGENETAEEALREIQGSDRLMRDASAEDRALIAVHRARILADEGRWEEAEASLQEMLPSISPRGPQHLRRAAERLRGEILFYRGDYPGSVSAHESALALARAEQDPKAVAAESIRHSTALSMVPGHEEEALTGFREAVEQLVQGGDFAEASFGSLCLGAQLGALGRTDEARTALARSIELAEQAHDVRRAGWARLNLADLEVGLSQADAALDQLRRARECFEQVEDALGQGRAALTEGRVALGRGELELAQQELELARSVFASRHLEVDELEVELRSTELDLARHDSESARGRIGRIAAADLARLRPDLVEDWERIRRQLAESEVPLG